MYTVTMEFHKETTELYNKHQEAWINKYNIKEKDTVTIAHKANRGEYGWWNTWEKSMDRLVGKTGVVVEINYYGILVKVEGCPQYSFPFFCLEKVKEEKKPEIENTVLKTFDNVLVRDSDLQNWSPAIFVKYSGNIGYPYKVLNIDTANIGSYSQCKKYEERNDFSMDSMADSSGG